MGTTFYKRTILSCCIIFFLYAFPYTLRQRSERIMNTGTRPPLSPQQQTSSPVASSVEETEFDPPSSTNGEAYSTGDSAADLLSTGLQNMTIPEPEIWNDMDKQCPNVFDNPSKFLLGKLGVQLAKFNTENLINETLTLEWRNRNRTGGAWSPSWCKAKHRVGIIIPFRDREEHLLRLLVHLTPILQRQLLDYRFIVAEQHGKGEFNKGRIMNAAFTVAENMSLDCVIFHDVDILPEDDRIPYGCPSQPFHLGGRVNTLNYKIYYFYLVGGALAFRMDHYRLVNGYSNEYWGWGGEDDDMGKRILDSKLSIKRPNGSIAKYTMLKHKSRDPGEFSKAGQIVRKLMKKGIERYKHDGLNTKSAWTVLNVTETELYFHVLVDVGEKPENWGSGK